jgi:hypothetical protein
MKGREERLRAARTKLAALKNGTVDDPKLGSDVVYLRWWTLKTLLSVGTNEKGTGGSLSTLELAGLYEKEVPEEEIPKGVDVVGLVGNSARWFAREGSPELCLWWAKENPARFGVRRGEHRELAEELLARYEGRLAAEALAEVPPDDFEEPRPPDEGCDPRDPPEDRGWASAPSAKRMKDELAEAPAPAPDVAYQERQDRPGLSMQNAGRGRRGEASDADGDLEQFAAKEPREGPWEAREREARANALRWNLVYNAETGERIPGVRFAPAFRIGKDGQPTSFSFSIVRYPEEVTDEG